MFSIRCFVYQPKIERQRKHSQPYGLKSPYERAPERVTGWGDGECVLFFCTFGTVLYFFEKNGHILSSI